MSPRPARPVTPERERQGVLRPLRRRLRPSPSLAGLSRSLHGCRPPLWAVLPWWGAVPSLGCAQPRAGGRDVGQSRPRCRGCSRQLPAPFRGFPSAKGFPRAHHGGKRGPRGLGRGRGHGAGRGPSRALRSHVPGQGSWAPRASAPWPPALSPLRAAAAASGPLWCPSPARSACARVTLTRLHKHRDAWACARTGPGCAPRACFKSPLGGNSFFLPFLFGCDLGEIDSQPVRWMLTVPLIYRVTYAK